MAKKEKRRKNSRKLKSIHPEFLRADGGIKKRAEARGATGQEK